VRTPEGERFVTWDAEPFPDDDFVPLEVEKGTVIVLDGFLPHLSRANRSKSSRHAFTLHIIEGEYAYAEDNWLRRPDSNPFRGI
jgi:phytanoyl-CoA hydroxylase